MSRIVDRAIDAAGLSGIAAARRMGAVIPADAGRLRDVDLLALGALADEVRRDEVGDQVRIYLSGSRESSFLHRPEGAAVGLSSEGRELTGLELLREVAIARIVGPRALAVCVNWTVCGLELAQVTLGFGANELTGQITSKRGLPLADGERLGAGKKSLQQLAHVRKRQELAALVRRAGRDPLFVEPDGSFKRMDEVQTAREVDAI